MKNKYQATEDEYLRLTGQDNYYTRHGNPPSGYFCVLVPPRFSKKALRDPELYDQEFNYWVNQIHSLITEMLPEFTGPTRKPTEKSVFWTSAHIGLELLPRVEYEYIPLALLAKTDDGIAMLQETARRLLTGLAKKARLEEWGIGKVRPPFIIP
jgi:hypothetical protein